MYICRHNGPNVKALRGLGHETPGTGNGYHWKSRLFNPYDHQKETAEFLAEHKRAWCTNGMRSGKTTSAAHAKQIIATTNELKGSDRCLVLCPVNVMTTAWHREMSAIKHKDIDYYICRRSTAHAKKALLKGPDVVIMNHDKLAWLAREVDQWLGKRGLVIVDECHEFRTHTTDRFECLKYLLDLEVEASKYRKLWLMSGTPVPNSPMDMYYLQKLVDPSYVPASATEWFAETMVKWFIDVPVRPGSSRTKSVPKSAPKKGHEELVATAMQPCIRFRTQDCVDMPDQAYSYYECKLSPEQKKAIKTMIEGYASVIENAQVIAANAGARVNKILQMCSGVVLDNKREPIQLKAPEKMKALKQLIEQTDGKVLVFCHYKATQKYIKEALEKEKYTCEIVNGETTPTNRDKISTRFQTRRSPHVLILHPKCEGMTLTKAMTSVWWGPPESNLQWSQANERQRGPSGQKTLVAMLYSSSIEKRRYAERIDKDATQTRTLDMYCEAVKELGTPQQLRRLLESADD